MSRTSSAIAVDARPIQSLTDAVLVPHSTKQSRRNFGAAPSDQNVVKQRAAIDVLKSEAGRRERIRSGITRFQIVVYTVVVLGVVLITYARATAP